MGRSRRPTATAPEPEDVPAATPAARPQPHQMRAALSEVTALIRAIRAEQARRGKHPSGEVQLALRAAQSAGHWLREAIEEDQR